MMMSVALRDLHRCYPNRFVTNVQTTATSIWDYNPYVTKFNPQKKSKYVRLGYPLIKSSNQSCLHFVQGFIDDLNKRLDLKVRLTEFRADIHWSKDEIQKRPISDPYWIIVSGGKTDFVTKWWDVARYQEVVDRLSDKINFVQIGGGTNAGGAKHVHTSLSGVKNLVGQTSFREAMHLCLHAEGLIVPVTCFMHLAAAVNKPAVVIAGGREHYTWEAYTEETFKRNMGYAAGLKDWNSWSADKDPAYVPHPFTPHAYLHTIGGLDCCRHGGCWKTKVNDPKDQRSNCLNVIQHPAKQPIPKCMDVIKVDDVVNAVNYYLDTKRETPQTAKLVIPELPKKEVITMSSSELKYPVTVCVLGYGDHASLLNRCVESIYANTDESKFKLRIALNEPSQATLKMAERFTGRPNFEKLYTATPQRFKYPMMREMFYDAEKPITTDWIMWFDDDSYVTKPDWMDKLEAVVTKTHKQTTPVAPNGNHMYGHIWYSHFKDNQEDWVKAASWYKGVPFPLDYRKKPPMTKSDFCTGGFWLITKEAIQALNWPDVRLRHNGGDIMLGAAMHQGGFGLVQHYYGVEISKAPRRGFAENHPGRK